jgi:hypothetical protein
MNEVLLTVIILFLLIGAYGLVKMHLEMNKKCKRWKVIAKAKVVSKSKFLPALGCLVVLGTFLTPKVLLGSGFNEFDFVFLCAMATLCVFYVLNYSSAEIAEEGLILGKWIKICIPWRKIGEVVVEENFVKTKRHVLKVEEGDLDKLFVSLDRNVKSVQMEKITT